MLIDIRDGATFNAPRGGLEWGAYAPYPPYTE